MTEGQERARVWMGARCTVGEVVTAERARGWLVELGVPRVVRPGEETGRVLTEIGEALERVP